MRNVSLYCPKCGKKIGNHFGDSTTPIRVYCDACEMHMMYNHDSDREYIKTRPLERTTSSGYRFW